MKQYNLCNVGFILLEATVGVGLFTLVMMIVLYSVAHMSKQCVFLQERNRALCEAIHFRERMKQGATNQVPFKERAVSQIHTINNTGMPYGHPSVQWCAITTVCGSQSVTFYYAEYGYVSKS